MPLSPSIYPVKITAVRPDGLTTVLNTTMTIQGSTDDVSFYLGVATETSTALAVTQSGGDVQVDLGIAAESNTAISASPQIADHIEVDLGIAEETNTALHAVIPLGELGIATEANTAPAATAFIAPEIQVVLGIATETNVALPATSEAAQAVQVVLGIAQELNSANDVQPSIFSDATKYVTCNLVSRDGIIQSNLTSLSWAWFDSVDPANYSTPVAKGQEELTDSSGELSIAITGTSLNSGQQGSLILRTDDGLALGAYNLEVS